MISCAFFVFMLTEIYEGISTAVVRVGRPRASNVSCPTTGEFDVHNACLFQHGHLFLTSFTPSYFVEYKMRFVIVDDHKISFHV